MPVSGAGWSGITVWAMTLTLYHTGNVTSFVPAGKGTKECTTIRQIDPKTPHMPHDPIKSSICRLETSWPQTNQLTAAAATITSAKQPHMMALGESAERRLLWGPWAAIAIPNQCLPSPATIEISITLVMPLVFLEAHDEYWDLY